MINKISISEEFLRSQDQGLLAPLFSGVNAEYAAVLMFKSLKQMRISQTAKDALAKAVADARQYFPGFKFERVPYYWLISKSKAKNSAVQILDKSGNEKSILIMRQIKSGDTLIGYDYIDLETGKLIYARSPEGIDSVVNGLKRLRNSKLAKLEYINDKSNLLIGEKEGYERNEQLKKYQRGDVSNLIPAESMLKKCEKILDERIKRLESAIAYYDNEFKKNKESGPPEVFKTVQNIVDQELSKPGSQFIRNESDVINALVMSYHGRLSEFEAMSKTNAFEKMLSPDGGRQPRHNVRQIVAVVHSILKAMDEEVARKRKKKSKPEEDNDEAPEEDNDEAPQELLDTQSHPIFDVFPSLREESFKQQMPGNIKGFRSEGSWVKEKDDVKNSYEDKLNAMRKMKDAAQRVLKILALKRESKSLSVMNFNRNDMQALVDGLAGCMTIINNYKQKVLVIDEKTKEKRFNKSMLGSIFEGDAALDYFTSRYIAIIITYIQMVFAKHSKA
jgi:hypothetical protein